MTISHYLDTRTGRGLRADDYEDVFGEGQADEEEGLWEHDEAERLRESKASDPFCAAEAGQLEKLADWGLSYEGRPDSRLDRLLTFLDVVLPARRHPLVQRAGGGVHRIRQHPRLVAAGTGAARLRRQAQQSSKAPHLRRTVSTSARGSPPTRPRNRCGCCWPPTLRAKASTCRPTAAGSSISTSRSIRLGLNSASAASTATGGPKHPRCFHFVPDDKSSTYAADANFMARIAKKIAQVEVDLIGRPGDRRDSGTLPPPAPRLSAKSRASTATR